MSGFLRITVAAAKAYLSDGESLPFRRQKLTFRAAKAYLLRRHSQTSLKPLIINNLTKKYKYDEKRAGNRELKCKVFLKRHYQQKCRHIVD